MKVLVKSLVNDIKIKEAYQGGKTNQEGAFKKISDDMKKTIALVKDIEADPDASRQANTSKLSNISNSEEPQNIGGSMSFRTVPRNHPLIANKFFG